MSVQGHLLIHDGKLYLAGGTSVSPAVYDLADGKCLNDTAPLELIGSTAVRGQELYRIGQQGCGWRHAVVRPSRIPGLRPDGDQQALHTSVGARDVIWANNNKVLCFRKIPEAVLDNPSSILRRPLHSSSAAGENSTSPTGPCGSTDCEGSVAFARGRMPCCSQAETPRRAQYCRRRYPDR